jgi:uncharacterized iron-regulated membrane protein
MAFFKRLVRQPQALWIRKAVFQVHLWTGIALALYVIVVCASGSILVFRNDLVADGLRGIPNTVAVTGPRLPDDTLIEFAEQKYPGYEVTDLWPVRRTTVPVEMWLIKEGEPRIERIFNPYTGEDMDRAQPRMLEWMSSIASLHDDLLFEESGRTINGYLAAILVLTCVTGAVVWWPGIGGWKRSLMVEARANWKRLNWTLHSAVGFWCFVIVLGFAFTGFYLVFQEPFQAIVDYFEPVRQVRRGANGRRIVELRMGDQVLREMSRLHFGRNFGSRFLEWVWFWMGLAPAVLAVTGVIMWWNRVLNPALKGTRGKVPVSNGAILPTDRQSEPAL